MALRLLADRALDLLVVVLGVSVIVFLMIRMIPGDAVAIARLAERPYRPVETAALAGFLAALGALVFVLGLGLPIPLFGR